MNPDNQISTSNISLQGLPSIAQDRTLGAVLASIAPLPSSALFIGLAEDGLPVLLSLRDVFPGPVLVCADAGAGKTRLLQTVARAIEHMHDPGHVTFAVVSDRPQEWAAFENSPHCEGVLEFHHALTTGYLHSAALRSALTTLSNSTLVLLIDGLESLFSDGDVRDAAHALLRAPSSQRIVPLVTLNTSAASIPGAWLDAFRVRLFGYIRDSRVAASLTLSGEPFPGALQPPCQFATPQGSAWLPFWLPELD